MSLPDDVPRPTLRRLPLYYDLFRMKESDGEEWISSESIAAVLRLGAVQVRKDLEAVGAEGCPKLGYRVLRTLPLLVRLLRIEEPRDVFLVGSGPLGLAIASDGGLARYGFRVAAVFDLPPESLDRAVCGMRVQPLSRLGEARKRTAARIAILAVDPDQAGAAGHALARAGVEIVLDLTGSTAVFPDALLVARVGFGARLSALAGELEARSEEKKS